MAYWKGQDWQNELALTQAWLTARLTFADPAKFPKLSDITGKKRAPVRQDAEQMLASVRALKSIFEEENGDGS
jgi:hypothetical protein